ncbi:MAG: VanW family protein [Oscillospiraceae bacterium]|nr:VanW family protein [Oscillospiraceae bacterium]
MAVYRNYDKLNHGAGRHGGVSGDTIVHSKRLAAREKGTLADEIREKACEADRQKRLHAEQEHRRRMAREQRKRELRMFLAVLVVVGVVFAVDALVKRTPGTSAEEPAAQTTGSLAEMTTSPETPAETDLETQAETGEGVGAAGPLNQGVGPDLLAEYTSKGTGSQNRYNNLKVACGLLNGMVLQPGEQFSFNEAVGERTTERGFLEASVYTTAENNIEVGGGICQVASTLYDCALGCDLTIDERTAHIYTVEYVPYGLDATVNWGSLDLKFTNNTGYPLEIQTEATDSGVTARLYGTKTTANTITLESEIVNTYAFETIKDVDYTKDVGYSEWETLPKNGYDVFSYQDIYSGSGELLEHRFVTASYYQKIDLVIRVGPYT